MSERQTHLRIALEDGAMVTVRAPRMITPHEWRHLAAVVGLHADLVGRSTEAVLEECRRILRRSGLDASEQRELIAEVAEETIGVRP